MLSSFSSSHHETWDGPIDMTVTFYTAQRGAAITTVLNSCPRANPRGSRSEPEHLWCGRDIEKLLKPEYRNLINQRIPCPRITRACSTCRTTASPSARTRFMLVAGPSARNPEASHLVEFVRLGEPLYSHGGQ